MTILRIHALPIKATLPRIFGLGLVIAIGMFCQPATGCAQQDVDPKEVASTNAGAENDSSHQQLLFSGRVPNSVEELKLMESHFAELAESVFPSTRPRDRKYTGADCVDHVPGRRQRETSLTFPTSILASLKN